MRILSLEVAGFGPFKDAQRVDFSAFEEAGIFLIGGRTGAGKSTILDAICFALYNSVPRYDGYSGAARLRSDHCGVEELTQVTLTFEANSEVYRVTRSPEHERPKTRGAGTTRAPARAELAILDEDDEWQVLETKIPEVAARIAEIVKLDESQFLQVILLAQNRFQEFLEADSRDRQGLLRTLFGTQRFADYATQLQLRAQTMREQIAELGQDAARSVQELATVLGVAPPAPGEDRLAWAGAGVTQTAERLRHAKEAEAQAVAAARDAAEALRSAQQIAALQRSRAEARSRLDQLLAHAEAHEQDKRRLQAAERAAAVEQRLSDADAAHARLEQARADEARALAAVGEPPAAELGEYVRELTRAIGALAPALEAEPTLPALTQAAAEADSALAAHVQAIASIDDRRTALRKRLRELDEAEGEAASAAKDLPGAQAHVAEIERARVAAERVSQLEAQIERLKLAETDALRERTLAVGDEERLRTLQLHGRAAVLAAALVDGEACPVCGAVEHPQPAHAGAAAVSDDQIQAARERVQRAQAAVDQASRRRIEAEARRTEQHGLAGGRAAAELEELLGAAHTRLQAAQNGQARLELARQERAEINRRFELLAQDERTSGARRLELGNAAVLARKQLADATELVE
ncbi:MAG TPA: SMC family ATPase, partial [Solirubrobacteraceae bacterium]|nr:SMC family ATPase [Solirubrobacteraceae bacterium]